MPLNKFLHVRNMLFRLTGPIPTDLSCRISGDSQKTQRIFVQMESFFSLPLINRSMLSIARFFIDSCFENELILELARARASLRISKFMKVKMFCYTGKHIMRFSHVSEVKLFVHPWASRICSLIKAMKKVVVTHKSPTCELSCLQLYFAAV